VKFYNDAASRLATLKLRAEIESTSKEQDIVQVITSLQEAYGALASADRMNGLNSTALSDFQEIIDRDFRALLKIESRQRWGGPTKPQSIRLGDNAHQNFPTPMYVC